MAEQHRPVLGKGEGDALAVFAVAALLAASQLLLFYPGALNPDSIEQYRQALTGQYSDWQPPLMSWLWHAFLPLGAGQGSLFILNTALYWLGFGLVASALWSRDKPLAAVVVLLSGASPLLLFQNRLITTDVGLASALIGMFGIVFSHRAQDRRLGATAWLLLGTIGLYAWLVRVNSAFALVPLALYAWRLDRRPLRWFALVVCLTIAAFPVSDFVNRHVIAGEDSAPKQRLMLYDIVGIAYQSGDDSRVRGLGGARLRSLAHCYTPLFWDTLVTPRCERFAGSVDSPVMRQLWLGSIARHPIAYAVHRLRHFNSETLFLVPAAHQCLAAPEMHQCGAPGSDLRKSVIRSDYLLKNFLVWPICWLALGLALALATRKSREPQLVAARALLVSGLLYGFGYLLVGVATNVRYFHWTVITVQTALLLILFARKDALSRNAWLGVLAPVVAVALLGYLFRLAGVGIFVAP